MDIAAEWTVADHHFLIERLATPRMVGAGQRHFRLWHNHQPASGGQWCYDIDQAKTRAEYVLASYTGRKVTWLEERIQALERAMRDAGLDIPVWPPALSVGVDPVTEWTEPTPVDRYSETATF